MVVHARHGAAGAGHGHGLSGGRCCAAVMGHVTGGAGTTGQAQGGGDGDDRNQAKRCHGELQKLNNQSMDSGHFLAVHPRASMIHVNRKLSPLDER